MDRKVIGKVIAVACVGLLVAACAAPATVSAADAKSFQAAYDAARAARKRAATVGFEWRDTAKLLKKAKKLAGAGDYAKAEKLAHQAQQQGELATAQAAEQANAWQAAVLR